MSATIKDMELVKADILTAGQLMVGDLISVGDDIVEVYNIDDHENGTDFMLEHINEFGEKETILAEYDQKFYLYVFIDED